ncbi:MAG: 16S rRNA (cytosine967-C5)-methyltransferase [Paracoccaceae bacterium]|jgi:16S rRNA (cytosine967-C5)-methyltransferase
MTPAARIAAAIEILDDILLDQPAERVLTSWARGHRFAGSKDRAAIRDHVFDALRCRQSFAALGGSLTGRGLMIGLVRAAGLSPEQLFSGEGYSAAPLSADEQEAGVAAHGLEALDCPDWLAPQLQASLQDDFAPIMMALRQRAPLFLRVNLKKGDVASAQALLAQAGVPTRAHPLSPTALEVIDAPRKVAQSDAYFEGLIEVQDAGSQMISDHIPVTKGDRVLDYCAGGGGKSLALGGRVDAAFLAHDSDPARMKDLPARAARANLVVRVLDGQGVRENAPYDLVLADVPCSGSGAWRRQPEAKWALTPERLAELCDIQAAILDSAQMLSGRRLAYVTCSILDAENTAQVSAFLERHAGWSLESEHKTGPLSGGDGLFLAVFCRSD